MREAIEQLNKALEHLLKARDIESSKDSPLFNDAAYALTYDAMDKVGEALEALNEQKEETCKEP